VSERSLAEPAAPAVVGELRGTCACGKPLGPTGECDACRRGRQAKGGAGLGHAAVVPGPGRPLDAGTRATLEPRFGRDFSGVRVHDGAGAAASASTLDAAAFTVGRDIVFGAGRYQPDRPAGRQLLAHELAHVAQQDGGSGAGAGESRLESEAAAVAGGDPGAAVRLSAAPPGSVQRQPASAASAPASRPAVTNPAPLENVGRGGNRFDAALDRTQCVLDLRVKADFKFEDVPFAWEEERKAPWKRDFIKTVMQRWSYRYFLVPSNKCDVNPCPRVAARLQVLDVSDPSGGTPTETPHLTVSVISAPFRAAEVHATRDTPRGPEYTIGVGSASTERRDRPEGRHQTTVEHEMGHHLGLAHIRCARNDDVCYGDNRYEKADIMGEGELVSPRDYEPFAETMNQFEPACGWRVDPGGYQDPGLGWSARGMAIGGLLGAVAGGLIGAMAGGLVGGGIGAMVGLGAGALLGAWLDRG
jgi:hypothetical protein